MKFEYNDYYKVLVIASIVVMTFSLIGLLINLFLLIKNNGYIKFDKRIIRYLVSIILLAFLFSLGAVPFKHGRHLFIEKEEDKVVAFGEIDCLKKTYGINKYVYKDENSFAYYIYIEGQEYYIMDKGEFKIGDKVEFEYLPNSKIILSINKK